MDTLFTDVVFELAFKVRKSLGKLFDFREYFCAFYSGSGEADTTASSFTTSGEEPLETTTSEMTGLLLKKSVFRFVMGNDIQVANIAISSKK